MVGMLKKGIVLEIGTRETNIHDIVNTIIIIT